jgi:hypothetical protein
MYLRNSIRLSFDGYILEISLSNSLKERGSSILLRITLALS